MLTAEPHLVQQAKGRFPLTGREQILQILLRNTSKMAVQGNICKYLGRKTSEPTQNLKQLDHLLVIEI